MWMGVKSASLAIQRDCYLQDSDKNALLNIIYEVLKLEIKSRRNN